MSEQFTDDQLVDIIARAESWRQYEENKKSLLENGLIEETFSDANTVDRQTIYDIAKAKGIDLLPKHIDKIIETFYPSKEKQLENLKNHDSSFSKKISNKILNVKNWEIMRLYESRIMEVLHKYSLPDENYISKVHNVSDFVDLLINSFSNFHSEIKRSLSFYKKTNVSEKRKIARLSFDSWIFKENYYPRFNLSAHFYDPTFLNKCGDTILELNKNFKKEGKLEKYEPTIHYLIDD